jgi:parallel beta-helix repeat protein
METRRAIVVVLVFSLVGTFFLGTVLLPEPASATILFVGGAGPGNHSSIQNAVFAADPGDTIFVFNGTYYENVEIYKPISLVGENKDNTTIDAGNSGNTVYVTGDRTNVTGFTLTGSSWGNSGVYIYQTNETRIYDCNISANHRGVNVRQSHRNSIDNNTIFWNEYDGVLLSEATNNLLSDNNASENRHGIFFSYSSNNTVTRNILYDNSRYGIILSRSEANVISSNNASSNTLYGFELDDSDDNLLLNNTGTGNEYGIRLYGSDYNTVSHGMLYANAFSGVWVHFATGNTIRNLTAASNGASGIYLYRSGLSIVSGNNATSNTYGITSQSSTAPNSVSRNLVTSQDRGINVYDSAEDRVEDNTVTGNDDGIYVGASTGVQVTGNNITSNSLRGIYIDASNTNIITANYISSNGAGIYVYTSDDNLIYFNNIIANLDQAYNNGGLNEWDVGYPSGGNYWSDYTGPDNLMGPDQDVPGSDGIGDDPYPITVGNEDRYPLVDPVPLPIYRPSPPVDLEAWPGDGPLAPGCSIPCWETFSRIWTRR